MADYSALTEKDLERKIRGTKVAIEKQENPAILAIAKKKLTALEAELDKRAGGTEKKAEEAVKKAVAKTEGAAKEVAKEVKKEVKKVAKEAKKDTKEVAKEVKKVAKKAAVKVKKAVEPAKKAEPKKKKTPAVEKFTLTIDGQEYTFADLKSKDSCQKAINAVKARRKEQIKHKEATAEGKERAKTISVSQRITDGFASVAKKAISEVPKNKIAKNPQEIKKELDAVEKAFESLFDKLEDLMDKKIPSTQRKQILDILTSFEAKVGKGDSKKEKATKQVRKKEDGGLADDSWNDDSWSYASLM